MTGTVINTGSVVAGGIIGLVLKDLIPSRVSRRVMQGIGLFTLVLGFRITQESQNLFLLLLSLVIGAVVGEVLELEERLDQVGKSLQQRFKLSQDRFTRGFVTTSLLFCVGPMAILGAIEDGLTGDYTLLLTKSIMDGVSAIAFASTLGVGVVFSAGSVFLYQGGITLLASVARNFLTPPLITELTAVGGALIIGLGLNILEVGRVKVANLLPALLGPLLIGSYFTG